MKPLRSGDLLSSGRRSRRPSPLVIVAVLAVVAVIGLVLAIDDDSEETSRHEVRRIDRLETPKWQSGELNRPTLPGAAETESDDDEFELDVDEITNDPLHIKGKVRPNQTLFVTLRNRGMMPDKIQPVVDSMSSVFDFRRSRPGDRYEAHLDLDGNILEFTYTQSREDIYTARLVGDQYIAEKVDVPKEIKIDLVAGKVTSSLFQAFASLGEQNALAQRYMDLFAFDFDFGADTRQGDRFKLLVEKVYLDGEFYKYGRIVAAEYTSSAQESAYHAFYFDTDESDEEPGEYYDDEGYSLRRTWLMTPVRNARFTSPFGPRFHPILKRWRPHNGVDWAAPTGTPVMASADGVVEFAGWKGGNGNLLVIRHDDTYQSYYAHLHRFARGMKKGKEVDQQDVVAYLGNTGLSTAPHLHYGVKKNGQWIDPMEIDTSRGEQLSRRHMRAFERARDEQRAALEGKTTLTHEPAEESEKKSEGEPSAGADSANP